MTNEIHRQVGDITQFTPGNDTARARLDAEITRLRGKLTLAEEGLDKVVADNVRLQAEIARLKQQSAWQSKEIDAQVEEIQRARGHAPEPGKQM